MCIRVDLDIGGKEIWEHKRLRRRRASFFPPIAHPASFFLFLFLPGNALHSNYSVILTSSGNDFRKRSYCSGSDFRKKKLAVFQYYSSVERSTHHTKHYLRSKVCNMCFFFLQCWLRHKHWKVNIFDSKLFYFSIKKIWKDKKNEKINFTSN